MAQRPVEKFGEMQPSAPGVQSSFQTITAYSNPLPSLGSMVSSSKKTPWVVSCVWLAVGPSFVVRRILYNYILKPRFDTWALSHQMAFGIKFHFDLTLEPSNNFLLFLILYSEASFGPGRHSRTPNSSRLKQDQEGTSSHDDIRPP